MAQRGRSFSRTSSRSWGRKAIMRFSSAKSFFTLVSVIRCSGTELLILGHFFRALIDDHKQLWGFTEGRIRRKVDMMACSERFVLCFRMHSGRSRFELPPSGIQDTLPKFPVLVPNFLCFRWDGYVLPASRSRVHSQSFGSPRLRIGVEKRPSACNSEHLSTDCCAGSEYDMYMGILQPFNIARLDVTPWSV